LTLLRGNNVASTYVATLAADGTHAVDKRRLTLDENENDPFAWTPDSKAVLLSSDRNGTMELFKQGVDQTVAENLMTSAQQLLQPKVTPDGSEILYISAPKYPAERSQSSIFAIPTAGGVPRLVLKDVNI
jgi:Tol biopolymer transport system component